MKIKRNVARRFLAPSVPVVLLDESGKEHTLSMEVLYRVPLPDEKVKGGLLSDQLKSLVVDIKNLEEVYDLGEDETREEAVDYLLSDRCFGPALMKGWSDNTAGKNTY